MLDFMIHYGKDVLTNTDTFLHQQRKLGKEKFLLNLEKDNIKLELMVNELQDIRFDTGVDWNERTLQGIHQLEQTLFELGNQIEEEILRIKQLKNVITIKPVQLIKH